MDKDAKSPGSKGRAGAQRRGGTDAERDLHNFANRVKAAKAKASSPECLDGRTVLGFINMMGLVGLSPGRQCFYTMRLWPILEQLRNHEITRIADITKEQCEQVLSEFVSRDYAGETKLAYALCLQKLVHYAKTGTLGSKKEGYTPEVSWITPSQYRSSSSAIRRQDLLTADEFQRLVGASSSTRNRALLWVMYEGAFRPGELLNMRVGGIEFADRYVMASTSGKTGQKHIALVYSFHPLAEWLAVHPRADDPTAPLWYSEQAKQSGHFLGYAALCSTIKKSAARAGIQKPVWGYLLRHTQMTNLSKRLPDQLLRVYGNWTPGSKMTARYTHLSGQDANEAILRMHGIGPDPGDAEDMMRKCPRCGQGNEPGTRMCHGCGLLLDEGERASLGISDVFRSRMRDKILRARAAEEDIDRMFDDMLNSGRR